MSATCPHDTDGDGDCHLCAKDGRCHNLPANTEASQQLPTAKLTYEQILALKVAELMLERAHLLLAIDELFKGARPAGNSRFQRMVLIADLDEVRKRAVSMRDVKWPEKPEPTPLPELGPENAMIDRITVYKQEVKE